MSTTVVVVSLVLEGLAVGLPKKTAAVARELGVSYCRLFGLIRYGKLSPPARDSSGHYIWDACQIDKARKLLRAEEREEVAAT
jgi:hypothetical protein